jgi:nitroreductase
MPETERLMTLFEAIARRRAVRAYRPEVVDEATVGELLQEAVRAPTAMHAEPWAFAVIQDRALLKKYSDLAKNALSSERADAAVAHPHAASASRAASRLSQPDFNIFYDASTLIVVCARPLGPFVVADCWLAAENLMLAACAMGLGTCCIGFAVHMLNRPEVKAELGIPADVVAVAPIIVGRPRRTMVEAASARGARATAKVLIRSSQVGDIILDAARADGAELTVTGTHGRRGVRRLFLGSVAEHLLRHADCPVVAVHAPRGG